MAIAVERVRNDGVQPTYKRVQAMTTVTMFDPLLSLSNSQRLVLRWSIARPSLSLARFRRSCVAVVCAYQSHNSLGGCRITRQPGRSRLIRCVNVTHMYIKHDLQIGMQFGIDHAR